MGFVAGVGCGAIRATKPSSGVGFVALAGRRAIRATTPTRLRQRFVVPVAGRAHACDESRGEAAFRRTDHVGADSCDEVLAIGDERRTNPRPDDECDEMLAVCGTSHEPAAAR